MSSLLLKVFGNTMDSMIIHGSNHPFLLTVALAITSCAYAAEHSVPCNTLPDAVQQRSKALLESGTTVHGCVKDVSGGKTTYEIELVTSSGSKDVTFSPLGDILEIEQQVDAAAVVAAAFSKAAGGGKLGKVESLTRQGQLVAYESTIEKGGRHRELAFRPDGTAVKTD
jgi:hypothetical protein